MPSGLRDFRAIIKRFPGEAREFYPLANLTTVRVGGKARLFMKAENESFLKNLLKIAKREEIDYFLLGNGSKVLFSDNIFKGLVIKLGRGFSYIKEKRKRGEEVFLEVGASTLLSQLVDFCLREGLRGGEFLFGIPGTLGGGIVNNAGSFQLSLSEIVDSVVVLGGDGQRRELKRRELNFSYRGCRLDKGDVVVSAVVRLKKGDRDLIQKKIAIFQRCRRQTQPVGFSFGCCFKNPGEVSAGKLIDLAGLKGLRMGGAFVSPKHANFLLNDGSARFSDFYQLIEIVKLYVEKRFGIILEEEVKIVY